MSDSVRPHRQQPTRLPHPWDSPDKNTGVGCHFLLQCTKVKCESEDAQSCPTLGDHVDCSLPGSSVHGIFQARVLEWVAIAFSSRRGYVTLIKKNPVSSNANYPSVFSNKLTATLYIKMKTLLVIHTMANLFVFVHFLMIFYYFSFSKENNLTHFISNIDISIFLIHIYTSINFCRKCWSSRISYFLKCHRSLTLNRLS